MKELLDSFGALSRQEKLEFVQKIMPEICNLFQENQQDMMSICKDMMKGCNVDMSKMMGMMGGMMDW